jgi:hypothetical protein
MVGAPETDHGGVAPKSFSAKMADSLRRAWADEKSRRRIVVVVIVAIAVVSITVVVSLFASLAGESQSYRDGYAAGGTAYSAYADAKITSEQACRDVAAEPRSLPAHDDLAQWVQGCADAFNLAASDN